LEYWRKINFMRRIWEKDPTLWFSKPVPEITDRLGWLILPEIMHEQLDDFVSFAEEVKSEGINHVVLLGMGGSSLAPEVFQKTFGNAEGYPELIVLDSTHPSAINTVEKRIDLRHTLFLVSSKSGTTIETISLLRYFWNKTGLADENQGRHFVAITDPGTPLMILAQERGFHKVFRAPSDVGGRYSALSVFGLLPAALIGMDVHKLLDRAWIMSENCAFCVSSQEASGLILGAALGELTKTGRNKVTFLTSPSITSFPIWFEQLIAESTGKDEKGIIPVVNEPITSPEVYGADRFFIYLSSEDDNNVDLDDLTLALENSGHPIVRIKLTEKINLSQEIFCWEMAVAAAGAALGMNPFNQPNVQMAKDLAKEMMDKAERRELGEENVDAISTEDPEKMTEAVKSWLDQVKEGDYLVIQAYLPPKPETTEALQRIRLELLNGLRIATSMGYGPRFLHSTGQLHKGGPNTGLFIQLVDEPTEDLEVPETSYTFGTLIRAQALGDYQALKKLDRRVLRINLKKDVAGNLSQLSKLIRDNLRI
jgi:transaldolase/glucose-6-phosphate isomerase